jgi:hypothetical protein
MRRLILAIVMIALASPLSSAQAQPAAEFSQVTVEVWPEYDRPTALVIYKLTLPAATALPSQISLRIPKSAGQPYNVAMQDVDNQLFTLTYTTVDEGDWTRINLTAPSANLQIEYYDPGLTKNGTTHNFTYTWPGDYKVDDMIFRFQEPPTATQVVISPTQGVLNKGQDGLNYYANDVGPIDAGTSFTFKASYIKNDDALTANSIQVQPQPTSANQTAASGPIQVSTPILVGLAGGAVLILGGVAWFLMQRRTQAATVPAAARHRTTSASRRREVMRPMMAASSGNIYCHQCGKRALPGDTFCRSCGTKLRLE